MLLQLQIENVAVIEKATINFSAGFNAMTGETGAGKSIVIDSINAVTGERTSKDIIRTGAAKAKISATFADINESAQKLVEELVGNFSDDGIMLMCREISADGRSIFRINGTIVPMAIVRQISPLLINIHGQHDSQQLFSPSKHLEFIDGYANILSQTEEYRAIYKKMCSVKNELKNTVTNDELKERKLELLNFQIEEIEDAQLLCGEEEELLNKRSVIRNSSNLAESIASAHGFIGGDEESDGALSLARQASGEISSIAEFDSSFSDLSQQASTVVYELEEILSVIRENESRFEFDPSKLNDIEERLDVIFRLKHKYGGTVEDVLSKLGELKKELNDITFGEQHAENLKKELSLLSQKTMSKAEELSQKRMTAGKNICRQIQNELAFLDMPNVHFSVSHKITELKADGFDEIEFLISANSGEDLKPLSKIASGGELSRIMLAIKTTLSGSDSTDTLIFDEIDTGVSGKTARKIGEKIRQISSEKQVICITHLAQISSLADNHLYIEKNVLDGRTYTCVRTLGRDERIHEIARIMGGETITAATLSAAEELIK